MSAGSPGPTRRMASLVDWSMKGVVCENNHFPRKFHQGTKPVGLLNTAVVRSVVTHTCFKRQTYACVKEVG